MLEKGYYDKADAIIESHGAVEAFRLYRIFRVSIGICHRNYYLMLRIRLGLQRRRHLVLLHFMRIFLLNQRENM